MIKFFGLLSKRKKVKPHIAASIFVVTLNNVIDQGFIEIRDFINNNNNLDANPQLSIKDIDWFRNIIFLGNIYLLDEFFEENEKLKLRELILDELYKDLIIEKQNLEIERFLDYEKYFLDLISENEFTVNAMAYAIFEKYNINDFQGDLFKRKNKPNPIFFNELKNLIKHFIWNWEDYLEKNKLTF